MPGIESVQLDTSIRNADATRTRAEQEVQKLKTDMFRHCTCVKENERVLSKLAETENARVNLRKLALMAVKLEGAYANNAVALLGSAETSRELYKTNSRLGFCYLAVAAGKLADIAANCTGAGRWITTAKSSIIDMVDALPTKDPVTDAPASGGKDALFLSQGANLALNVGTADLSLDTAKKLTPILTGSLACCKDIQATLAALIAVAKAIGPILSTRDFSKVKQDFVPWFLKLLDAVAKTRRAYEVYTKLDKLPPWPKSPLTIVGENAAEKAYGGFRMQFSNYISVVKYTIEAVINICDMFQSFKDSAESWNASQAEMGQADRQLSRHGTGALSFDFHNEIDLKAVAGLKDSDLLDVIRTVDSAPDAHDLFQESETRAKDLARDAEQLAEMKKSTLSRIGPLSNDVNQGLTRIKATDTELKNLRLELERQHDVAPLKVALNLTLIDMERNKIAAALGGQ